MELGGIVNDLKIVSGLVMVVSDDYRHTSIISLVFYGMKPHFLGYLH